MKMVACPGGGGDSDRCGDHGVMEGQDPGLCVARGGKGMMRIVGDVVVDAVRWDGRIDDATGPPWPRKKCSTVEMVNSGI